MHVVFAPDSFKGSVSAQRLCELGAETWRQIRPQDQVTEMPLADGGEGTGEVLGRIFNCQVRDLATVDSLRRPINGQFYWGAEDQVAVIDMAAASGLTRIADVDRNPLVATSYGTGVLIKAALDLGAKTIYLGLGGTATNDAGVGICQALGIKFLTYKGEEIADGGGHLHQIQSVDSSQLDERLKAVTLTLVTDVNNRFTGEFGASRIFAPQKCAPHQNVTEVVAELEKNLVHLADLLQQQQSLDLNGFAGGGAAGGTGALLQGLLNANYQSGIDVVLDAYDFDRQMDAVDLIISGEGRMDSQSLQGKVIQGVMQRAQAKQVPVVAVVGSHHLDIQEFYQQGLTAVFSVVNQPLATADAMAQGETLYRQSISNISRLIDSIK